MSYFTPFEGSPKGASFDDRVNNLERKDSSCWWDQIKMYCCYLLRNETVNILLSSIIIPYGNMKDLQKIDE
jgi:fumarate reductase subunit C